MTNSSNVTGNLADNAKETSTSEWTKASSWKKISCLMLLFNQNTNLGPLTNWVRSFTPLRLSIDLSGARQKEGHFHHKNFLRASKWGITRHTCSIIPKSLYCGLGLIPILNKGILGWWSSYGMRYLISKLSESFYNASDLLFLVHHWGQLTSDLRVMFYSTMGENLVVLWV